MRSQNAGASTVATRDADHDDRPGGDAGGQASSVVGLTIDEESGLCFEHLEPNEAEFLYHEIWVRRAYLRHGISLRTSGAPLVVDVGANIGLFSLLVADLNPRAKIIACEPAPRAFAVLERNLASVTRARCLPVAVRGPGSRRRSRGSGTHDGGATTTLHVYPDAPGESSTRPRERAMQHVATERAAAAAGRSADVAPLARVGSADPPLGRRETVTCEAWSLGEILRRHAGGSCVDLLKASPNHARARLRAHTRLPLIASHMLQVDCEGDELEVLRGVTEWRRIRQVVAEVHDLYGRLASVCALLRRHGFHVAVEQQVGGDMAGYRIVVPRALRLFHVYATREPRRSSRSRGAGGSTSAAR